MSVPSSFAESIDEQSLREAISAFGTANGISETDLLASLGSIERWYQQFTDEFRIEHRGTEIIWRGYESLIWALGNRSVRSWSGIENFDGTRAFLVLFRRFVLIGDSGKAERAL